MSPPKRDNGKRSRELRTLANKSKDDIMRFDDVYNRHKA